MGDRALRLMPYVVLCGVLVWIVQRAAAPISDPDDWWHLRLGSDLIAQRSLAAPHWSRFATVPWVPTEPLPEIVSVSVERWLGYPGLAMLFAMSSLLVVVTIQLTNRREAALLPATVATVFVLFPALGSLTSRPQLVSFVLLPIVLAAGLQTERDLKPRWWLVPLIWFWSLCHGFWFIGVAYGFLFLVGIALSQRANLRTLARLAAVPVTSLLVVSLNPAGLGVLEAPFAVNSTASYISEWQRTHLLTPGPLGALLMVLATATIWWVTRQGISWSRIFLLLSAAFWAWYALRTVIVSGIVVAPLFAGALDVLVSRTGRSTRESGLPRRFETMVIAGWSAVALAVLAFVVPHTAAKPGDVPLALDDKLDQLPPHTVVFNEYVLGGWIAWRHPDLSQYIDGLATPYSVQHYAAFHRAETTSPAWYAVVQKSDAPVALVESDSPLAMALPRRGWTTEGTDAGYVLLRKPTGVGQR